MRDDEEQYRRAELIFRLATAGSGVWLASVVLVEVVWVLRVVKQLDWWIRNEAASGFFFVDADDSEPWVPGKRPGSSVGVPLRCHY